MWASILLCVFVFPSGWVCEFPRVSSFHVSACLHVGLQPLMSVCLHVCCMCPSLSACVCPCVCACLCTHTQINNYIITSELVGGGEVPDDSPVLVLVGGHRPRSSAMGGMPPQGGLLLGGPVPWERSVSNAEETETLHNITNEPAVTGRHETDQPKGAWLPGQVRPEASDGSRSAGFQAGTC